MRNLLIILSGPSGVGKGTIVGELLKRGNYALSISCTTRPRRIVEVEGKHYFFITKEKFKNMIDEGGLLEYSEHFDNFYGTPKAFVDEKLKTQDVILEIECNGAFQVKKSHPDAVLIMVAPPSKEETRKRLRLRGTEDEEEIERRLQRMDYELSCAGQYDYKVVNDDLKTAVLEIENIIKREKGADI